jgi:hypothetical protein
LQVDTSWTSLHGLSAGTMQPLQNRSMEES